MAEGVNYVVSGVKEVNAALTAMDARADAATLAALKAMQNAMKRNVKSRMRGRARWNHRGKSARTGEQVDIPGPRNSPRSGGPGKFTGALAKGVGGVRRPKALPEGGWQGGVGIGGNVQNNYKREVEDRYPAFKPALDKTLADAPAIWSAAWQKAIHK